MSVHSSLTLTALLTESKPKVKLTGFAFTHRYHLVLFSVSFCLRFSFVKSLVFVFFSGKTFGISYGSLKLQLTRNVTKKLQFFWKIRSTRKIQRENPEILVKFLLYFRFNFSRVFCKLRRFGFRFQKTCKVQGSSSLSLFCFFRFLVSRSSAIVLPNRRVLFCLVPFFRSFYLECIQIFKFLFFRRLVSS